MLRKRAVKMTESAVPNSAPADQPSRDAALRVDRSFIVQAPAGSGKTELLTQRFLKLLSVVDKPERVLAITFTRKATQEMRNRIMSRLQQARDKQPVEPHERQAVKLAAAVLAQDERHQWGLLETPGRLRIFTIDALCTQLLIRDPQNGAVISQLQVLEDARPLYRLAIRRMLEDLETGTAPGPAEAEGLHECLVRVLVHLDGDMLRLEDMLTRMLTIRDQWTGSLSQPMASQELILRQRQDAEGKAFALALGEQALSGALDLAARIGAHLKDADHPAGHLAASAATGQSGAGSLLWRYYWLAQILTTNNNTARGPKGITAKSLFPELDESAASAVNDLQAVYREWHENPVAISAIERMARSAPLEIQQNTDGLLEDILKLLRFLLAELNLAIMAEGKTDFQFLAERALFSLGANRHEGEAFSEVLLSEDSRLDHLLLDEFQDTSHTQHRLIVQLTSGWTVGDGRTLFLVGDPMQSIYRFREADVGLFTHVIQQGRIGDVPVEVLKLTANFRSRREIILWINQYFSPVFPALDDRDSGAVHYHPATAECAGGGCVQVHAIAPGQTDEDEARQIADLIRTCQQQDSTVEIAVLARARNHLQALVQALFRARIDFEAVKVDALAVRPVIQDLLAITRALLHPADRVAAAALLRAPWCGLRLVELHRVIGEAQESDIWRAIQRSRNDSELPAGRRQRLAWLCRVMDQAQELAGNLRLRERVESVWLQLGGPHAYADAGELDNAAQFFELLDRIEGEGQAEMSERLTDALATLYAQERPARVQLMTIHQAKGLEFDVVILPGLHRVSGKNEPSLIRAQQFGLTGENGVDRRFTDSGLLMAAVTRRGQDGPSVYRYLGAVDAERQQHELTRVLYVAATRARRQLHVFGRPDYSPKKGFHAASGSFLQMLMPAFEPVFDASGYQPDENQVIETTPATLPLLYLDSEPRIGFDCPEVQRDQDPNPPSLPDRDAVALGEALHLWLELIHDYWDRDWTPAWFDAHEDMLQSLLLRTGADPAGLGALLPRLKSMIRAALESEAGHRAVSPLGCMESHAELALFRRAGTRVVQRVIDRLYRDESGSWHIVDYKTGRSGTERQEGWSRQLGEYAQLTSAATGTDVPDCVVYQVQEGRLIPVSPDPGEESIGPGQGVPA